MLATKSFKGITAPIIRSFSLWGRVDNNPPDPILGLLEKYRQDKDPRKVNLTAGAYRDEVGKPWILPSVRMALEKFNNNPDLNLEYVPINGNRAFIDGALGLAYGEGHRLITGKRLASAQTMSGCGALYMGMQFYKAYGPNNVVYCSDPTWPIQNTAAEFLGLDVRTYPYYDPKSVSLDFNGMMNTLNDAPEGAMVILHACAHNPTGFDLNHEQWGKVMELCVRKRLLPYFDMAYQGFASGNLSTDNWAVRLFADNDVPVFVGTSFAKNMGLYGTRTGTLS